MKTPLFTVDGIRKLHGWTHASLTLVLDHLSTLPADDYGKKVAGFGFGTLREQVIHIFNCEGFWVHVLQGRSFVNRRPEQFADVAAARALQQEVSRATHAYLATLTDAALNANSKLQFPDPDRDEVVRTPALVLHHMLTHAFHHKGQVVAMCRLLGHPAPDTDLDQFE